MWICTKYGFYSTVCARHGNGEDGQPIDPGRLMVRGRVRAHLEALKERYPDLLGACEIQASTHTDYAYRFFVATADWSVIMSRLALDIDYGNFKSEVQRHQGRGGAPYVHALHEVWSSMHALQKP